MNRMLIVGNGFDLEHGLKTAYWNFCEYLEENHLDFLIAFEKMYNFYPVDFGDPYVGKDAQQKWEKDLKSKLWESFEEEIQYLRKVAESVKAETIWHVYWHDKKAEKMLKDAFNQVGIALKYRDFNPDTKFWD